jgi:polynucleotide 5'-kinase involved in rRNA processing
MNLLTQIYQIFQPNQVIYIKKDLTDNYVDDLKVQFLSSTKFVPHNVFGQNTFGKQKTNETNFYVIEKQFTNRPLITISPKIERTMRIISYFKVTLHKSLGHGMTYKVNWEDIRICFQNKFVSPSQSLYALNCTIVSLLNDTNEYYSNQNLGESPYPPIILSTVYDQHCLGYGIIKSIDSQEKTFTIITPLCFEDLQKVNTMASTSIDIPPGFLFRGISCSTPYLQHDSKTYKTLT